MFVFCRDTDYQIFGVEFTRDDFVGDEICDKKCSVIIESDIDII
jgi:hypothetical protein